MNRSRRSKPKAEPKPANTRLPAAIAAIDAVNAEDPNTIEVHGEKRPKELVHAQFASDWIENLTAKPSEALRLAARASHLRRWTLPRTDYPEGRKGYLKWRQDAKQSHAEQVAAILGECGYDEETIADVQRIILRQNLAKDREAQVLEDALCLVFFETQLEEVSARLDPEKLQGIAIKTLQKMSPEARLLTLELPLPEETLENLDGLIADL